MRVLTDEELTIFFEKLRKYLGPNIKYLIEDDSKENDDKVFRMIKNRVYYLSTKMLRQCSVFAKDKLIHCGVCFGQFSKTKKFRLHITCLGILKKYTGRKVWLRSNGEQNFLYGNHVLKAHIAKISEKALKYKGVIVMSLNNTALGFGVLAKAGEEFGRADPTAIYVFNQADLGEYLRIESQKLMSSNN